MALYSLTVLTCRYESLSSVVMIYKAVPGINEIVCRLCRDYSCPVCDIRLREPDLPSHDLISKLASKYRYSGRTQYQVQLVSSMSASATLDRSANATLDQSTTASLASSRRYTGASKSLENGLYYFI